ncbi:hypothetical protein N431DRAFT_308550, partial [Stipitochalara longipes BDJ]
KFTCFPNLPKELQLDIWELTLPGPRVVKLRYSGQGEEVKSISRARIPVALHVCRNSRDVAKKVYKLSFGLKKISGYHMIRGSVEPKVYFSFDRDILFIDTEHTRPCEGLRGISVETLRTEAKRFHSLIALVQDLGEVQRLAAWEYLPMVGVHSVSHGEEGEVKNPWAVFQGLKEPVKGVRLGCRADDKDLRAVEDPDVLEGREWEMKHSLKMITKLEWKQTLLISGS